MGLIFKFCRKSKVVNGATLTCTFKKCSRLLLRMNLGQELISCNVYLTRTAKLSKAFELSGRVFNRHYIYACTCIVARLTTIKTV